MLAAQAEELGYSHHEERAWGGIFRREVMHGALFLKYRLQHFQGRWHADVQGCMRFLVFQSGEERILSFCSTPHRLENTQARRWRFPSEARDPELRWIAKEIRGSYTRTLLPFLKQVSTPISLLTFMTNEYQPYKLASADLLTPFRSAALVLGTLLRPEEAAPALAQLNAAELVFSARWEAYFGPLDPS
ncbi:hypothetical protein K7W42_04095 [Deinococcus sp. HMF7604]|uniref:hypothetical protein n=1 Tax=Deinococcus betulae TaxID=2873312 RepID=UPI001CC96F02|nr:hypothetical protein [Deinococcus betulae]MBZ9750039.1 hypothetical protein [Deinococcus betulae]